LRSHDTTQRASHLLVRVHDCLQLTGDPQPPSNVCDIKHLQLVLLATALQVSQLTAQVLQEQRYKGGTGAVQGSKRSYTPPETVTLYPGHGEQYNLFSQQVSRQSLTMHAA
jgi:hypothetical protein